MFIGFVWFFMTKISKIVGRAYLVERFWMKLEEAWVEELSGSDCGLKTCNSGSDCDTFSECLLCTRLSTKYIRV